MNDAYMYMYVMCVAVLVYFFSLSEICASKIEGFSDDYSFLIHALLDLYDATYCADWVEWAWQLQQHQDELFWDSSKECSGYFMTTGTDPSILLRMKEGEQRLFVHVHMTHRMCVYIIA